MAGALAGRYNGIWHGGRQRPLVDFSKAWLRQPTLTFIRREDAAFLAGEQHLQREKRCECGLSVRGVAHDVADNQPAAWRKGPVSASKHGGDSRRRHLMEHTRK